MRLNWVKMPLFLNPAYGTEDTIVVAGSGRSGTTWLGGIIASAPGFMSIFEPFDYRHVPEIETSLLRLYISSRTDRHIFDELIAQVLMGKIRNSWTLSDNGRKFVWRVLVKDIRMNLFIAYVQKRFNSRIVFITRHPCATVLSRLQLKWDSHLEDFVTQKALMRDYLMRYESLIRDAKSELERHTVMWCIENLVPLRELSTEKTIFCMYEYLLRNPREEINRIFSDLGLTGNSRTIDRIQTPSRVTLKNLDNLRGGKGLQYWQEKLSNDEVRKILDIVDNFEIPLYGADTMPKARLMGLS